jgi:serine/threonine protein kinase/TolB-like protein
MTSEQWKKLNALFQEAVELQGEARAAHLARVCGDDGQLRREAEQLLAAHEREGSFLDSPIFAEAAAIADDDDDLLVGRSIGPYKIISKLGRGGMGEVYLAQDARLGRKVAIKLLASVFTNHADLVQRFEQEARAASALNHPNILTIHEVGKASTDSGDAHYIVSEFVEGETLRALMWSNRLAISQAIAIADQVASALSVAHEAGIIHRDIKPENVMVRPDGLVKVLDFGLAKLMEQPAAIKQHDTQAPTIGGLSTKPGIIMGTAKYMSPEQARGQRVDHRTDIFSLGVMLYEMVAGRRPFEGATNNDVIAALLTAEPPPLSSLASQAPGDLEQITDKCLAKEREARYQSAKELIADLKTLQTGSQANLVTARRRTAQAGTQLLSRRWLMIATVVALLIAAVAWFLSWQRPPAVRPGQIKSLVVLPLENLSGDPAQEYLADGMTDALIGDLAKIGSLRVISRTSAMRYKGAKKPLPDIASELNVDAVVEGTMHRSGDRVSIRARLIHAGVERQLWADSYERDFRDALAMQSEIARAIAREVQAKLTPAEQARLTNSVAPNRKALDDYLQGRYLFGKGGQMTKAIGYFQNAIKEDPTYAPAYAGLAACYNTLGSVVIGELPPPEARRQAVDAAVKALRLDGALAEAHAALGFA